MRNSMKKITVYVLVGVVSALIALGLQNRWTKTTAFSASQVTSAPVRYASMGGGLSPDAFVKAAQLSTPAVVHITTSTTKRQYTPDPYDFFNFFFGEPAPKSRQSSPGCCLAPSCYDCANCPPNCGAIQDCCVQHLLQDATVGTSPRRS